MQYQNNLTNNDRWIVEHVFPNERDRYFVEAGACNGIQASSCYVLEKYLHWKGICIEPNDDFFQELIINRPRSICVNQCLAEQSGKVTYIQGDLTKINPMLGGIKANLIKYRHNHQEVIAKSREITKEAISLFELCQKYNTPKVIDYLAMDIEGSELPVLATFPFEEYKILAISIEGVNCNDLLAAKGYINVKNPFNTDQLYEQFFLHQSIFNTEKHEISANHYLSLANNYSRQTKVESAISAYQQAISIEPDDASIYVQLATYLKQQGNFLDAIANYRQAIAIDAQQPAWVYYTLGNIFKEQNQLIEAEAAYDQAIAIDPQQPAWLYCSLGDVLQRQNKLDEAIAAYDRAIAIDPQQPAWVYRCLGQIWRDLGQLVKAKAAYQKAIAIDPQQPPWLKQFVEDLES